ncbi:MAG: heavy-metal-associated domain-containing protein [Gammaproteobacteria bacterium]|nr:heavy-metal-associated domain-containing protein [Gammaproteobacteria bacterium]
MKYRFEVENIKCGGCAANIKNHLQQDERILNIEVDIDKGCVSIESEIDATNDWIKVMTELGYPVK